MYPSHSPEDYEDWPLSGGGEPPFRGRLFINRQISGRAMAKKGETFFIRGQVITTQGSENRVEAEIDLGSYVNLGINKGTALRVHGVQMQICDPTGLPPISNEDSASAKFKSAYACTAITTAQVPSSFAATEMPQLNEDYVMYSASVVQTNQSADDDQGVLSHSLDIAPQDMVAGYLLAVDTLYMYAAADDQWVENLHFNFLLECSLENISQATAVSLSLSQN